MFGKLVGGVIYSIVLFGGLMFLPALTFDWWRAWVLLGVVFVASSITMFTIFPSRPDLLAERYKAPIQRGQPLADKLVTPFVVLSYFGLLIFDSLDLFRFHLLGVVPVGVAVIGIVLFIAGWTLVALAMRENAFAAPVVKRQEERNQRVIDTGPYAVVRHPMYAGALPVIVGMVLWLGSWAAVIASVVPLFGIVLRVLVEERFLARELPGYREYTQKVRWRVLPGVW
jgi:protein-S-isoprenylcysteine O-methyltransferase Ste14